MNRFKIETIIAIGDRILIVHHSPRRCYQFSIIDELGYAYDFPDIFYSAKAAEKEGREAIKLLSI